MSLLAFIAVSLAVGTWLGIRWAEAGHKIDNILETVLNTPLPEPSACAACDPGAADTGARAGAPPLSGAGSTLNPPAPTASTGQSAQCAPGLHK
jgi:hypothetical protein